MEGPNKEDKWKIEWERTPNTLENKDLSKIKENGMYKTQWVYWKYNIMKRLKVSGSNSGFTSLITLIQE